MAVVLLLGAVVTLAQGHSGQPWVDLAAAYGVSYVVFLFTLIHLTTVLRFVRRPVLGEKHPGLAPAPGCEAMPRVLGPNTPCSDD